MTGIQVDSGVNQVRVLGFAGSLRLGSLNRALLRAAVELAPDDMRIEVFDLADIPLYNEDVEAKGEPPAVATFKSALRAADGMLIACPEYNHGVPGVLKNAIDWASRPPQSTPLAGKATAVIGASPGLAGSAQGQSQLRQAFIFTDTPAMQQPEVLVSRAHTKFDPAGRLTDEPTRKFLAMHLLKFREWIERFRAPRD
jgi:chromate reductase